MPLLIFLGGAAAGAGGIYEFLSGRGETGEPIFGPPSPADVAAQAAAKNAEFPTKWVVGGAIFLLVVFGISAKYGIIGK